jgi:Tfp pilus assembly protein PilF
MSNSHPCRHNEYPDDPSRLEKTKSHLWPVMMLLAVTLAVYGQIIGHEFLTVWDDNYYVTTNEAVQGISWQHLRAAFTDYYLGNYAPVQILSYMLDYELWGLNAGGFLFTNILIHLLNGLLVYRLFVRWYGDRIFCLFAASLYLLHPVQVESVAWISQRKNLLAMLFFLLAWEGYCCYREAGPGKGRLAYLASVAAFVLSLLAKSMTVVFPLVLVLYDLCFPEGGLRLRLRDKIPYVLAAAVVAAIAIYSERPEIGGGGRTGFHGGSPWATFLTMLPVFCHYLGMLFWPVGLSAEYAPTIHRAIDLPVAAAALLLAALAFAGVRLFRIDRRLGFWVIFFWVGLLPVSQIVPMLSMINDRYLYLPLVGVSALAGSLVMALRKRIGSRRSMLHLLLVALLLVLSAISFVRAKVWRNSITLWDDAVSKVPASDRSWGLLADAYRQSGNIEAVRRTYERALAYNPDNPHALNGLGEICTRSGQLDQGYAYLDRLVKTHPRHAAGWVSLGNNFLRRHDYAQAEKAYLQALAIQPDSPLVGILLGDLAVIQGRLDKARVQYGKVEEKGANNPDVAYRLARVEALAGSKDEALAWLEKALQRGYEDSSGIHDDEGLATIWDEPRFYYLMDRYFPEGNVHGR